MKFLPKDSVKLKVLLLFALTLILTAQTINLRVRNFNNIRYVKEFSGANVGAKIAACIADLPSTGGTCIDTSEGAQVVSQNIMSGVTKCVKLELGHATYTWSSSIILSDAACFSLSGKGQSQTQYNFTGTGYWLDSASGTTVVNHLNLKDFALNVNSTGTGAIRFGRGTQAFADANFRSRWNWSNLYITGPNCASGCTYPTGSIGIYVTQLINHYMENITVLGFEKIGIIDRSGNGIWNRTRWQSFRFGLWITEMADTGSAPSGVEQDLFQSPEFLGPTTTGATAGVDYGCTVKVSALSITFINALYESQVGGKSQGLLCLNSVGGGRASSANFTDIQGQFSNGSAPDYTIAFGTDFYAPTFIKSNVPIAGFPDFSMGAIYTAASGGQAKFIKTSPELTLLAQKADQNGAKIVIDSQINSNTMLRTAPVNDFGAMLRVTGSNTAPSPTSGKGLEIQYQSGGDQAIITAYDRTTPGFKPVLIQSSLTHFDSNGNVQIDASLTLATETNLTTLTTPSVAASNRILLTYTAPTNITNFANGSEGKPIYIRCANGNATLIASGILRLAGAANFVCTADDMITLVNNGGNWWEMSRSVN